MTSSQFTGPTYRSVFRDGSGPVTSFCLTLPRRPSRDFGVPSVVSRTLLVHPEARWYLVPLPLTEGRDAWSRRETPHLSTSS